MGEFEILADWITDAGFRAVIIKTSLGHNCGYVGIEKNHPLFGKSYSQHCDALIQLRNEIKEGPVGKRGIIPLMCWDGETASMDLVFDVHGSVTFSKTSKEYPVVTKEEIHWIGFDCGHVDDTPEVCDLKYCTEECESLAKQIKKVKE